MIRAFLDVAPYSLVGVNRRFIALMVEAVRNSETSVYSNELHGAVSQKALIFILNAVRT
jgi:hypothetical protein